MGRPSLRVVDPVSTGDDDAYEPAAAHAAALDADEYVGYAPPTTCSPRSPMVGDLIEVEDGSGVWVVVDEVPEDDVVDPGMIAVSWRGDGDESGSVSLPDDYEVAVRRPEEVA